MAHADSAMTLDRDVPRRLQASGRYQPAAGQPAWRHGGLYQGREGGRFGSTAVREPFRIHITEGRVKEAMRDADRAFDLDKTDPDAWYNRACANYIGQNNDGALRDLERSLGTATENADALFLRGVVKGELYKEEAGIADIEAALAIEPDDPRRCNELGRAALRGQAV